MGWPLPLVLALFAISVGAMAVLLRAPFGRTLLAIRENERRALFLGIPVERHIWMSFSISCFIAALAGTLYALLNNFADPLTLHYSLSGYFVVMTVTGGMRVAAEGVQNEDGVGLGGVQLAVGLVGHFDRRKDRAVIERQGIKPDSTGRYDHVWGK